MALPSVFGNFFKKGSEGESNYLSLVIAPDRILASIWTFENDQVKTLGYGHKSFQNEHVLVHQAAIAIDSAGQQAKVDITKTVFGLSDYFLEDGSLSPATTKTLKRLATELELDPQAFVPISAGISHLLKVEESTTPHTVAIGVFGDYCEVHLLSGGTVVKSATSNSPANIEKLKNLTRALKEEDRQLPARIVIYGLGESTELAEKIAKADWADLFINVPKIDFLDDTELSRSVAYAQAADILGYDVQIQEAQEETSAQKSEEPARKPQKANELGFVEGEDILLSQKIEPAPKEEEKKPIPKEEYAIEPQPVDDAFSVPQNQQPKTKRFNLPIPSLVILISTSGKKFAAVGGILIFILALGAFVYGQTASQAEVKIIVNGQELAKELSAKAQVGASISKVDGTIGATEVAGRAFGSQKAVTTGQKKIGESAKGEVTVFNITSSPKTFPSGTTIITGSGLKFSLDEKVEATSASKPGQPSQSKARVTATEVGPQYNLDPGQQFSFTEFDEFAYWAQNDASFSGGAERQTTVVTEGDLARLEQSLLATTREKAKEDLKNQAGGQNLQDGAVVVKILKKQFDKKLEEEAPLLSLDMEVEATAIVYMDDDLKKLLSEIFSADVPENLQIRPEDISLVDLEVTRDDNQLQIALNAKAEMVPKINEDELKDKIAGKSVKDARAKVKEIPEVAEVEVSFKPNIPILSSIPRNKSKITFKIETI